MAIKLCPVDAIYYIEDDEPILDKTLKCNCDDRESRGLTPMSDEGYNIGCACADGCGSGAGDDLYACGGTPYGRITIEYNKCIKCGTCVKECCGDAIDMVDDVGNTDVKKNVKMIIDCCCGGKC
jgi:Fe-S-cluster-containing hydrogenase component 2